MSANEIQSSATLAARNFHRSTYESDRKHGYEMACNKHEHAREMQSRVPTLAAVDAARPIDSPASALPFLLQDAELSGLIAHHLRWNARVRKGVYSTGEMS